MMRKTLFLSAVLLVFSAVVSFAAGGPQGRGGPPGDVSGRLEERIHTYVLMRMAEELNLDKAKEDAFFRIMREHFKDKRALIQDQFKIIKELEKNDLDSRKINDLLDSMEKNRVKQSDLEGDMWKKLRKELTAAQCAKILTLWPRIQQEVHEMIGQMRGKQGGKGMKKKQGAQDDVPPGPPPF